MEINRTARYALFILLAGYSVGQVEATCQLASMIQSCTGTCQYITVNGHDPSQALTGSFWGLGGGDPALGPGDDNGTDLARGNTDPNLDWLKSYQGHFYVAGAWSNGGVDNCILDATTPSPKRTVTMLADATGSQGYFGVLCAAANAFANFDYAPLGEVTLAPVPQSAVVRVTGLAEDEVEVELSSPSEESIAPGLHLESSCGTDSVVTGYRTYYRALPLDAPPPSTRVAADGWTAVPGQNPFGTSPVFRVTCGADCALYVANSLVFDSGFETPYLSSNVCVTGRDTDENGILDGCDGDNAQTHKLEITLSPVMPSLQPRNPKPRRTRQTPAARSASTQLSHIRSPAASWTQT